MKKILISFLFISLIYFSLFYFYRANIYLSSVQETQNFTVLKGSNLKAIANNLKKKRMIPSVLIFKVHAYLTNNQNKIKTGPYLLKKGASPDDVLKLLVSGKTKLIKITIPEGKNLYEIADILEVKKIVNAKKFIEEAKQIKSLDIYSHPIPNIEGHLFPDTYYLAEAMPEKQVINLLVNEYKKRIKGLNWNNSKLNPYEILILASIVEKETGLAQERKRIAGVFTNRLEKRMRIQSDPTTIYGIFENFDGNLRRKDLRTPTPYNTYTLKRLPIGPISNPGLAAIQAVLQPEEHSFLFFVSKNDGSHTFSKTYTEHKKKVYRFQIRR